jgi:predicted RNase H-like HicB family nuclease
MALEETGMAVRFVLTDYLNRAMARAIYDKLEDGSFSGTLPPCAGVVAFGGTLRECEDELRSTLEDWVLVGLKLGHSLPIIDGIDLNKKPTHESMDAV